MLEFEQQFFEEEVRDGFHISSMMKKAWAVEMEVLSQVSAVCKKHGIPYYAAYGTLLGAIRHKGFIPWDDDIDIILKRKDYIRLLNLLPAELPEGYFVSSYYTSEAHCQPWAAVMNTKHILKDAEKIKQFWGCPYVCGIDVMVLDFVPQDAAEDDMYMNMYNIVFGTAKCFNEYKASGELYQFLPQIEQFCGVTLRDDDTLQRQLYLLADRIAGLYQEEECAELTMVTGRMNRGNKNFKFDKQWFSQTIEVPFENITISVPKEYDKILRTFFGEDYMTPIRFGSGHDYPFYKRQQQFLDDNHIILPISNDIEDEVV
ncbi:MAG: LicD family protein [Lachnospiraceae bacterium]|nr:LicD family protein [Lachnospiraceae bacterium]